MSNGQASSIWVWYFWQIRTCASKYNSGVADTRQARRQGKLYDDASHSLHPMPPKRKISTIEAAATAPEILSKSQLPILHGSRYGVPASVSLCAHGIKCGEQQDQQHNLNFRHPKVGDVCEELSNDTSEDTCLENGKVRICVLASPTDRIVLDSIIENHGGHSNNNSISSTNMAFIDYEWVCKNGNEDTSAGPLDHVQLFAADALVEIDSLKTPLRADEANAILARYKLGKDQIGNVKKIVSPPFKKYRRRMRKLGIPLTDLTPGPPGPSNILNLPLDVSNLVLFALAMSLRERVSDFLRYRLVSQAWRRALHLPELWKSLCAYWIGSHGGDGWVPSMDAVQLAQSRTSLSWQSFYLRNLLPLFLDEIRLNKIAPNGEKRIAVFYDTDAVQESDLQVSNTELLRGKAEKKQQRLTISLGMKLPKADDGRDIQKILQLNLSDISHTFAAMHFQLPMQGRLYFFVNIEDCDSASMKVVYYAGDKVKRTPAVEHEEELCRLFFYEQLTIDFDECYHEAEKIRYLEEENSSVYELNWLFGFAKSYQGRVLDELIPANDKAILLLQFDMGCGALYYVMKESDLRKAGKVPLVFSKKVHGVMHHN